MAKLPGLVQRGPVYHYRRRVPLDVRDAFGGAEVLVSLQTTYRKAAAEAWFDQSARWEDEFNRLRCTNSPQDRMDLPGKSGERAVVKLHEGRGVLQHQLSM